MCTNGRMTSLSTKVKNTCQLLGRIPHLKSVHVNLILIEEEKQWSSIQRAFKDTLANVFAPVADLPLTVKVQVLPSTAQRLPAPWREDIIRPLMDIVWKRRNERLVEIHQGPLEGGILGSDLLMISREEMTATVDWGMLDL